MKRAENPNAVLALGIAIGSGIGIAFGSVVLGMPVGLALGVAMRNMARRRLSASEAPERGKDLD